MDKTVENLKKLSESYLHTYHKINEKVRDIEEIPLAKKLVGKCFKYKNSYGSNKYWNLYFRVLSCNKYHVSIESFQQDYNRKIEFNYEKKEYATTFYRGNNYISISTEEYFRAQKRVLDKLNQRYKKGRNQA